MTAITTGAADKLTSVTVSAVVGGAAVLAIFSWTLAALESFGQFGWFAAGVTYGVAGAIVVARVAAYHPHARFGAANTVTLCRLIVASVFAGLAAQTAIEGAGIDATAAWFFTGLAVFSLALDGFDGWLARRSGLTSTFGARFDMETDALFIMLLAVLAVNLGKAGAWVLLSGLLRYIFVAAGWMWPALAQPLPFSRRRKMVAGIQSGALAALLAPIVIPPMSTIIAAVALGFLIISFWLDAYWSLRNPVPSP